METKHIAFGIIAVVALVVLAEGFGPVDHGRTIQTTGTYTVSMEPDEAVLVIGFESTADTAALAQDKNARQMADILNALRYQGLDDDNFKTLNFYVGEEYSWRNGNRDIDGYQATHTLEVTFEDVNSAGRFLDAAVKAGANDVRNIRFQLTDDHKNELKREAIARATQDARDKAEAMAMGSGSRIKRVVSISDSDWNPRPYLMAGTALEEAKSAAVIGTQIQSGDVEVTARVTATYELA